MLHSYWRDKPSELVLAEIMANWVEELRGWPIEMVRDALRAWVRESPNKRPNPGHIVELLSMASQSKSARKSSEALALPAPPEPPRLSADRAQEIMAEVFGDRVDGPFVRAAQAARPKE